MKNIIASEWLKLRRKGMLAALVAGVIVTALGAVISVVTAGQGVSGHGAIGGRTSISVAQLTGVHGLGDVLGNASTLLGIIVLGVVAASVAGEFSVGTLRNLLIREPRRVHLLAGKLLGLASAIALAVVLCVIVGAIAGGLAAASQGFDVNSWATAAGIGNGFAAGGQFLIAILGWGALGAVLAIVFRSPVIAVVVGVVYALPLEGILGNISNGVARWLPGKLLTAFAAGGNSTASLTAASWTIAFYGIVAIGGALWLFKRRDVPT